MPAAWLQLHALRTVSACGYIDMYRYYVVELVALGHCKVDSMVHNSLAAGKKPLHDISQGTLTLIWRDTWKVHVIFAYSLQWLAETLAWGKSSSTRSMTCSDMTTEVMEERVTETDARAESIGNYCRITKKEVLLCESTYIFFKKEKSGKKVFNTIISVKRKMGVM